MHCGFVVPVYNHGAALESVVNALAVFKLPIIIVDDGNDEQNRRKIREAAAACEQTLLVERAKNGGKGAAMKDGVRKAAELGLSHILQIDSDGQHDTSRIPRFLELAAQNPDAVICGYPEYAADAP